MIKKIKLFVCFVMLLFSINVMGLNLVLEKFDVNNQNLLNYLSQFMPDDCPYISEDNGEPELTEEFCEELDNQGLQGEKAKYFQSAIKTLLKGLLLNEVTPGPYSRGVKDLFGSTFEKFQKHVQRRHANSQSGATQFCAANGEVPEEQEALEFIRLLLTNFIDSNDFAIVSGERGPCIVLKTAAKTAKADFSRDVGLSVDGVAAGGLGGTNVKVKGRDGKVRNVGKIIFVVNILRLLDSDTETFGSFYSL